MSKRENELRRLVFRRFLVSNKMKNLYILSLVGALGIGSFTAYQKINAYLIAKDNAEKITEFVNDQTNTLSQNEVVEEETENEPIEEVVELPPSEIYSSDFLDEGNTVTNWSDFYQMKTLGLSEFTTGAEISAMYPAVVGGIEIPGTNICNIITRGPDGDRDYYLHKDLKGNYFYEGIIYEDNYYPSLSEPIYNQGNIVTLYGHHMASGYLFRDIDRYKNQSYADDHSEIILHYLDETVGIGQVMSAIYFIRNEDGAKFINPKLEDEESFYEYVDLLKEMSLIQTDVYPVYGEDQLVNCQTCSYYTDKGLILVTFVVPKVKQITNEDQRYLVEETYNQDEEHKVLN